VLEYISNENIIGAKTLFATHYHELTELEGKLPGVVNYCIDVREKNDTIIFLRKIKKGGADHSYGIQVAKLAGLPESVIVRSKQILSQLGDADITKNVEKTIEKEAKAIKKVEVVNEKPKSDYEPQQLNLFASKDNKVIEDIKSIDIMNITPFQALNILNDLQQKLR
jgi:DNA mismatch repair protein MutS